MKTRPLTALAAATILALSMNPAAAHNKDHHDREDRGGPPQFNQCLAAFMDDNRDEQWNKLEAWLNANYARFQDWEGRECSETGGETGPPTPGEEPRVEDIHVAASSENTIILTGTVLGAEEGTDLTFRASAYEFTGQAGYPEQLTIGEDGAVRAVVEDYNDTDPRYWQLELGGDTWDYGDIIGEGEIVDLTNAPIEPSIPPEDVPDPVRPEDGETGGDSTNRENVTFEAAGIESTYHLYADGVTEPAGLLVWMDGSGGYGIDNPDAEYLIDADGDNGLRAVAEANNLILLTPEAPGPDCDGEDNCWYNQDGETTPSEKAAWLSALITDVKTQYDVNEERIVVGGYSSGAQGTTRWFLPLFGEEQSVDLAIAVAYGGAPAADADFTDGYPADTVVYFNTGTDDSAYTDAPWGALGGHAWYKQAGFVVDQDWSEGVGHGRGGDFDDIVAEAINEHLPAP